MLQISQCRVKPGYTTESVRKKAAVILGVRPEDIKKLNIRKESLDARKKPELFYALTVDVEVEQEKKILARCKNKDVRIAEEKAYIFPTGGTLIMHKRPVIIGAGPAGLVCAYFLAVHGFCPIVLERGKCVEERQKDVERFWETGVLDGGSNVQFGEGGAGTFSDGKLNTLVKDKYGRCAQVLRLFVQMGAPADIIYKNKPHVGTDMLIGMVRNLRLAIENHGGTVRFESMVTDFEIKDGSLSAVIVNGNERIETSHAVLAIGHSARDTFSLLGEKGICMEPKPFAVGYRVQHVQRDIDMSQYGEQADDVYEMLGAASYKLTAQTSANRGVYTFCMCPGGYVVNASSEEGRLAVNGMSYRARDSKVANSAVIISVTPEDYNDKTPLGGVEFQRRLEEAAYAAGGGDIPVQTLKDYKSSKATKNTEGLPLQMKGRYRGSNLRGILPKELEEAFLEGMESFGRSIRGFDGDDTVLAGIESRTSSPVKIVRDDDGISSVCGIYPCGEGAGYAGGITSAAMDGLLVAEKIAGKYTMKKEQKEEKT
nr:NAD(P)-binding protein [Lachnospiraceae bacterium]